MGYDSDIVLIRDWLKKQKHLPQDVDDNYIKTFIIASKGSVQTAKNKYEKFHMLRHLMEKEKLDWDPFSPRNEGYIDNIAIVKMPQKTPEGYTIYITKLLNTNENREPDANHFLKYAARLLAMFLCDLWDNKLGDCQLVMITDWTNSKLGDFRRATPSLLAEFAGAMSGGVPMRLKGSHEIGILPVFEFILKTINSFLPKKLQQRRFAHSKLETLLKHIPKEYLPSDYGGNQPSVLELHEKQKEVFKRHLPRLLGQKAQVLAEKPFVPAAFNIGSSDTFKKLDID